MSFSEICAQYKKKSVSFKTICLVCAQYKKNGAIQKDLVADNEWSPYKSFLCMGTIMKFVINMEVLDAELERIQNRLAFSRDVL